MSKISRKITYSDLTGGLNNVNSPETMNSSTRKTETPDIINIEHFKLGGIKTMDGNILFGNRQDDSVVGGWEYTKGQKKYMLIALAKGDIKIYNPVTEEFDLIYKFSSYSERVSFCNMNNGVVVTNGKDDPFFYEIGRKQLLSGVVDTIINTKDITGTGTKFLTEVHKGDRIIIGNNTYIVDYITNDNSFTITENAKQTLSNQNFFLGEISQCNAVLTNREEDDSINTTIRGLAIQYYNGRLWIGTDNGLFYSGVGEYNGWDILLNDAGVLYSIYNDSSEIKALGLYSDYMLIHKEFNTYLLTCSGDSTTIQVVPYSNVSCDSQQSWIVSNTKYYVYSRENMDIYPLTQRTVFSDKYIGDALTNKVRDVFNNLRDNELEKIFCVSLPKKRWMVFYMPMVDQLGSGYGLIYDHQTKSFWVRKVPQEVTVAFNFDNNIYLGTADGLVLKEFTGSTFKVYDKDKDIIKDDIINAYYKSPWFDWSDGYTQSFAEFAIEIADDFNNDFYIRTFKDGSSPFEDRVLTSDLLSGDALVWDGQEDQDLKDNDTVWDEDSWVTSGFNHIRMVLPNNVFDKFQLELGTNSLGQGFAIYGYQFRRIETEEAPW